MASTTWIQKHIVLTTLLTFTLLHYHQCMVNGDYDTATPGSLFTTRTWMQNQMAKNPEEFIEKVVTKSCAKSYTSACMKLDIVGFVDRLAAVEKYQIVPGLELVRENSTRKLPADFAASLTKEHPNDVDARLDAFLVKRLAQYLNSHSVNFKLFDPEGFAKARKFTEQKLRTGRKGGGGLGGGGLGGGKGGYGMLAAAGMMMGGTLGALAFGTIAALAGKAMMTALMSLMLSAVVGLKGLGGGGKGVHYEIIQKPVYSHSHSHSSEVQHVDHGHGGGGGGGGGGGHHSGYGRSFVTQDQPSAAHPLLQPGVLFVDEPNAQTQDGVVEDGHKMAYSAYEPQQ